MLVCTTPASSNNPSNESSRSKMKKNGMFMYDLNVVFEYPETIEKILNEDYFTGIRHWKHPKLDEIVVLHQSSYGGFAFRGVVPLNCQCLYGSKTSNNIRLYRWHFLSWRLPACKLCAKVQFSIFYTLIPRRRDQSNRHGFSQQREEWSTVGSTELCKCLRYRL